VERISDMVQGNFASLEIDFVQLSRHATALAIWTVDAPTQMLPIFNESAARVVARYFPKYLDNVHSEIFVRVTGLPVLEHLRDIRCSFHSSPPCEVPVAAHKC
jgi:DNA replicative helicase MCM subunit Mcm2 (Cdc46/Mcm family)